MPQMENTCKLCAKCLKKDEHLDNATIQSAKISSLWSKRSTESEANLFLSEGCRRAAQG